MQTDRVCEEQALMPYPVRARKLGVEGYVEIDFVLGEDGIPKDIKIISRRLNKYNVIGPDGNTQFVMTIFDDDAIKFIRSFRYATHNSNGRISGAQVRVPLTISLTENVKNKARCFGSRCKQSLVKFSGVLKIYRAQYPRAVSAIYGR